MIGLTYILFFLAWATQNSVFATSVGDAHRLATSAAPPTDAWTTSVPAGDHLAVPISTDEGSDVSDLDQAEIAQVVPVPIFAKARLVQLKKMSNAAPTDHVDDFRGTFPPLLLSVRRPEECGA